MTADSSPSRTAHGPEWAVITANFGRYDAVRAPPAAPGAELLLVTDHRVTARSAERKGWKAVVRPPSTDPWLDSRLPKFEPHHYTDRPKSVWIDARADFRTTRFLEWAHDALGEHELAAFHHPDRQTIDEEAAECHRIGLADERILEQIAQYGRDGFLSAEHPLIAGMLIIRRRSERVERFGSIWKAETARWHTRDQIALPYAAWRAELAVRQIPGSPYELHEVTFAPHRRRRSNETLWDVSSRRLKHLLTRGRR